MRSACLSEADLEAADLSEADLSYARLNRANLTAANLSHAVLDHADFSSAVLTHANLTGASLRHVKNLTQAQVNESTCDLTTIFPAHLVHPISRLEVVRNVEQSPESKHQGKADAGVPNATTHEPRKSEPTQ